VLGRVDSKPTDYLELQPDEVTPTECFTKIRGFRRILCTVADEARWGGVFRIVDSVLIKRAKYDCFSSYNIS